IRSAIARATPLAVVGESIKSRRVTPDRGQTDYAALTDPPPTASPPLPPRDRKKWQDRFLRPALCRRHRRRGSGGLSPPTQGRDRPARIPGIRPRDAARHRRRKLTLPRRQAGLSRQT